MCSHYMNVKYEVSEMKEIYEGNLFCVRKLHLQYCKLFCVKKLHLQKCIYIASIEIKKYSG